jgi:hypothetical protein
MSGWRHAEAEGGLPVDAVGVDPLPRGYPVQVFIVAKGDEEVSYGRVIIPSQSAKKINSRA